MFINDITSYVLFGKKKTQHNLICDEIFKICTINTYKLIFLLQFFFKIKIYIFLHFLNLFSLIIDDL